MIGVVKKTKIYDCGCTVIYSNKKKLSKNICHDCKKTLCFKHAYYYIDGNNISITKNGYARCLNCYIKRYKLK